MRRPERESEVIANEYVTALVRFEIAIPARTDGGGGGDRGEEARRVAEKKLRARATTGLIRRRSRARIIDYDNTPRIMRIRMKVTAHSETE